jgi:hypothetical protein
VVISANEQRVDGLVSQGWASLSGVDGPLWTDDYSSVITVLK